MPLGPPGLQPGDNVVLFDGVCRLCSVWARFLLRFDTGRRFKLATMQSDEGQAILSFYGLPLDNYETLLLVENGGVSGKSDAVLRIVRQLPFPWPILACFRLLPRALRDWLYDQIARNRYKLFGKTNVCFTPSEADASRFLNDRRAPDCVPKSRKVSSRARR